MRCSQNDLLTLIAAVAVVTAVVSVGLRSCSFTAGRGGGLLSVEPLPVAPGSACDLRIRASNRMMTMSGLIGSGIFCVLLLHKCWQVALLRGCAAIRHLEAWSYCPHGVSAWIGKQRLDVARSHWVIAATRGFFEETVASVQAAHRLVFGLQTSCLLLPILRVATVLTADGVRCEGQVILWDSFACQVHRWRHFAMQLCLSSFLPLFFAVITTPATMWAPTSLDALAASRQQSGYSVSHKLKNMPWLILPLFLLNLILIAIYLGPSMFDDMSHDATGWLVQLWFLGCAGSFAVSIALLIWFGIAHDVLSLCTYLASRCMQRAHQLARRICSFLSPKQRVGDEAPAHSMLAAGPGRVTLAAASVDDDVDRQRTAALLHQLPRSDLNKHYREKVLLLVAIYVFGTPSVSLHYLAIKWILRVALLLSFLFLRRDRTCTHDDLRSGDASLGLLISAPHLAKALSNYLDGGRPVPAKLLPTYKATVLRMHHTLAVSYKWKSASYWISTQHSLNMSRFQMKALLNAIRSSRCEYVWLDKLSVIQEGGSLQDTLLSRMLVVYASAMLTVVIMTRETESSHQYHKRAWTVQEYCVAREVTVSVEEPGEVGGEYCAPHGIAMTEEDAKFFRSLRHEIQQRLFECKPMWLYGIRERLTSDVAASIVTQYQQLAARTFCTNPGDRIRALCPLLCCTPVEGHRQLLHLVKVLSESSQCGTLDEVGEALLGPAASASRYNSLSGESESQHSGSLISRDGDESSVRPGPRHVW